MAVMSIYVTAPSPESAKAIAATVVKERLAACANILAPCTSVFHWDGRLESISETPIILKTSQRKFQKLLKRIKQMHVYEIPCICWQKMQSTREYERWVELQTK